VIDLSAIPEGLKEGESWHLLSLDPNWVWLAKDEDEIVGILIAAPCHGLAFIWRIKMLPEASPMALLRLLRGFIRDIQKRGYLGYMALLNVAERKEEQALARIAFRAGAMFTTATTVVYGSVNAKHVGER
jgi:hypothetical protein